MTEISEFIYQIFAALLFCAGISLMLFWSDNFSDGTDSSYKSLYETFVYSEDGAVPVQGDGYRIYTRDEIIALSFINSVDKIVFSQGLYSNLNGNTDELKKYLKKTGYKGKTVYFPGETVMYLVPEE